MIEDKAQIAAALPGYEIGGRLGRGAFGLVLAGRHRELGRDVAIKILPADQGGVAGRSWSEARVLASLDHPHIIRVYDALTIGDLHLLVMELLAGGPLTTREYDMTVEAGCAVGLAVAAALSYAHGRGVLHRDIKPSNVLFDAAGRPKVADFGIAKIAQGTVTTASAVSGTPRYMAPEQILGGQLGAATDLYALGIMLYELLGDDPPFDPALPAAGFIHHHLNVMPAPPTGVAEPIAEVVMRCLAKDPADRHPSARAFALDLAAAAAAVCSQGWSDRAGIGLSIDDAVRAAAEAPATRVLAPHIPDGAEPQPDSTSDLPTQRAAHPSTPDVASDSDGATREARTWRPGRSLPRRFRLPAAAAAALLAIVGVILALTLPTGGDPAALSAGESPASGASAGTPTSTTPTASRRSTASQAPTANPGPIAPLNPRPVSSALTGHTNVVSSVALSPDGRTMASASWDSTVRLWDVTDRSAPRPLGSPLTGHTGYVFSVDFSPDGRTLASAGWDSTVRLWDVSDRDAPRPLGAPLTGHAEGLYSVAFAPDGRTLASASDDNTVRLWDVTDVAAPRLLESALTGHTDYVFSVAFSPDGRTIATASGDYTVRLWDVTNRNAPRSLGPALTGHTNPVRSVAFSPDGHVLASASDDKTVRLWDVTDLAAPRPLGAPVTGHTEYVFSVAFSPDGRTLASASGDFTVRLWDVTEPGVPVPVASPLTNHASYVYSVAFAPDGRTIASGSGDFTVRLWALN